MTQPPARPGTSLRAISRRAVNAEITAHAMRLFDEQGFAATTVEQIAEASGISSRSFFRYFATKEDVVIGDAKQPGEFIRSALASRPPDEAAGVALRHALHALLDAVHDAPEFALQSSRLMLSTPSLRARHLEKQLLWQRLLVPDTIRRLHPGDPQTLELKANAIVASALGCFDVAVLQWAASDGNNSLPALFDTAIDAVAAELHGATPPRSPSAPRR
jgi:AcrR family transcriptional regulator